ncbi:MAG: acyl-CoA thioesterase [Putridiphycobacter sp.]
MIESKIQIRYSDCDMMKHVNNAVYLQYFETARISFFNAEIQNWDWDRQGFILKKNTVEYHAPVVLNDKCTIQVNCIKIGDKSFTLSYKLMVNQQIKAYGESIIVCFDYIQHKTISIPDQLKLILQKHFEQQ